MDATHPSLRFNPITPANAPPRWARALQIAAAIWLVVSGAALATMGAGCGGNATPFCSGGFIRKDAKNPMAQGTCEGKCDASKCAKSNICVDNHCALQCTSLADCAPLTQDCVAVKDDEGHATNRCQDNGKGSIGTKCPFTSECAAQFACPDGKVCDPMCSGAACACAADKCKPLTCLTSGAGDAEAYCTMKDCHADADCPGGFWCDPVRDPHKICGTDLGKSPFCGTTMDPCVQPSMDMANGTTYEPGTACAVRNQCRIRKECAPCATDIDCSAVPGQHCTTMPKDGTKACTRDCLTDPDCDEGFQCTSGACVSRYGSCVGTGKFCEPCRNDLDCGGMGSTFACFSFNGVERMCLDTSLTTSCAADTDCPTSPGGLHGLCGQSSASITYQKCFYPPQNSGAGYLSCWCSSSNISCFTSTDCCSKKCIGADLTNMIPGKCK